MDGWMYVHVYIENHKSFKIFSWSFGGGYTIDPKVCKLETSLNKNIFYKLSLCCLIKTCIYMLNACLYVCDAYFMTMCCVFQTIS